MKKMSLDKVARAAAAGALALSLVACGGQPGDDTATTETVTEEATEATEATEAAGDVLAEEAKMENPWKTATSADEAAAIAGLDGFSDGAGTITRLDNQFHVDYSAMAGLAEASIEYPACEVTVRKGTPIEGDDVSGDYNSYAHAWTTQIGDVTLNCAGNREGESQKTTWSANGYDYSITALGLGGDDAFGLLEEDLAEMVPYVK